MANVANLIINYWDNEFYLAGDGCLGFAGNIFYVNQTTDQLVMLVPNVTDPGVITIYVYPKGTTVYVYGWAYSYSEQGGEIELNPDGRIFAYEVQ
jgi:hypothetical protein